MNDMEATLVLIAKLLFVWATIWLLLKYKIGWLGSIRSIATLMVAVTFCYLSITSKLEAKDFMLIASMVFNFYFLVKDRLKAEEELKLRQANGQGGQK